MAFRNCGFSKILFRKIVWILLRYLHNPHSQQLIALDQTQAETRTLVVPNNQ